MAGREDQIPNALSAVASRCTSNFLKDDAGIIARNGGYGVSGCPGVRNRQPTAHRRPPLEALRPSSAALIRKTLTHTPRCKDEGLMRQWGAEGRMWAAGRPAPAKRVRFRATCNVMAHLGCGRGVVRTVAGGRWRSLPVSILGKAGYLPQTPPSLSDSFQLAHKPYSKDARLVDLCRLQ